MVPVWVLIRSSKQEPNIFSIPRDIEVFIKSPQAYEKPWLTVNVILHSRDFAVAGRKYSPSLFSIEKNYAHN